MAVLIQYDDRTDPLFEQLMARNRAYCDHHEYTYWRPTEKLQMPPYWIKVALVQYAMNQPGVQFVAWLDSDACVHARERRLEELFRTHHDFLISEDAWSAKDLNVGVFIVRVTERSRRMVAEWLACYPEEQWAYTPATKQWTCKDTQTNAVSCVWAGPAYEQGAFNERILPQFPDTVQRFPVHVFDCSAPIPPPDTFSCHLISPGTNKHDNIRAYLKHNTTGLALDPGILICLTLAAALWLVVNKR